MGFQSQVVGNEATPWDPSGGRTCWRCWEPGRLVLCVKQNACLGTHTGPERLTVADTNLMQVSSFQDTHHKADDSNRGPEGHVRYPKALHSTMFHWHHAAVFLIAIQRG